MDDRLAARPCYQIAAALAREVASFYGGFVDQCDGTPAVEELAGPLALEYGRMLLLGAASPPVMQSVPPEVLDILRRQH